MTDSGDLFGGGGGSGIFPKLAELEDKLIMFKATHVGPAPKYKAPGEFVDRATVDLVVFDDDGTWETFEDVWFTQPGIVNPSKKALKPGARPWVLGRVTMFPMKEMKDKGIDTTDKIKAARAEWLRKGGKGDEPGYAWGLADFTPAEADLARKYLDSISPFAAAE